MSIEDFKDTKFTISYINGICEEFARKRYIQHLIIDYDCKVGPTFYLTHEGYSYFEIKKADNKRLWLKSAWIPIIVSFVSYMLLNYIMPTLLSLLKYLYNIL